MEGKGDVRMKLSHHVSSPDPGARLQQQAALHRKCLLALLARPDQTAVRPVPSAHTAD